MSSPISPYATHTSPAAEAIAIRDTLGPNGVFGGNVDGAGYKLTGLSGLSVGYTTTKEVWLGIRTGGKAGSGSKDDPYSANTFAQVKARLNASATAAGTIVRLRDGEIPWGLHSDWYARPKVRVIGEGRENTILKLDPSCGPNLVASHMISGSDTVDGDGLYVSDLTLDGNWNALNTPPVNCSLNGVVLHGNNNTIERVRFRNGYGSFAGGQEHYAMLCQGRTGDTTSYNNKIIDCIAELFKGDYGNGIHIVGPGGNNACVGGLLSGIRVSGYYPIDGDTSTGHCTGFGLAGGTARDCLATGCQVGIYAETLQNTIYENFQILDCYEIGVDMNVAGAILRPKFKGGYIEMRDDFVGHAWAMRLTAGVVNPLVQGVSMWLKVTGNTPSDPDAIYGILGVLSDTGKGHQYIGNNISTALTHNRVPTDSYLAGNINATGGVPVGLSTMSATRASFSAHAAGTLSLLNDTATQVLLGVEEWDTKANFASSTFTAEETGDHIFMAHAVLSTNAVATWMYLAVNGAALDTLAQITPGVTNNTLEGEMTVQLTAGDTVKLYARQNSGGTINISFVRLASFQGRKL